MSIRSKLRKSSGALTKRHKEQIKNKDSKGRFPSIINKDALPAGVEQWFPKEGTHYMDIIPWLAGPDMPFGQGNSPITEEGEPEYVLDVMVHLNVGPTKHPYICPYENFGLPCPICEYIKSHELDKEIWKELKAKRRVLYLVWVHDDRETEKKGIQLLEVSHFVMEEKIAEIAKLPKEGGVEPFSDPDHGKMIGFTRKGSGKQNTQYLGHKLITREARIPDKILDQTFAIDQVVYMKPTYEEIEKAFAPQMESINRQIGVVTNADAGNTFGGYGTGDDVPDWDSEDEEETRERKRPARSGKRPARTGKKSSTSGKTTSGKTTSGKRPRRRKR